VLPPSVTVLGWYGERRLVALAPGAIAELIDEWKPSACSCVRSRWRRARAEPPRSDAADPVIQTVVDSITQASYQAVHLDIFNNDGYPNRDSGSAGGSNAETKIKNLFLSYGYTT